MHDLATLNVIFMWCLFDSVTPSPTSAFTSYLTSQCSFYSLLPSWFVVITNLSAIFEFGQIIFSICRIFRFMIRDKVTENGTLQEPNMTKHFVRHPCTLNLCQFFFSRVSFSMGTSELFSIIFVELRVAKDTELKKKRITENIK